MNASEFKEMTANATVTGGPLSDRTEETHISWVVFSKDHAYKIKKPVKLSFLDFSTLDLRKKFCDRELQLNRRFSKIYLEVLPVTKGRDGWHIGEGKGEIVDYALKMKRLDSSKRMDRMLKEDKVDESDMAALAEEVANFHEKAEIINIPFDLQKARSLFNDIEGSLGVIQRELGQGQQKTILEAMAWSDSLLQRHAPRVQERIEMGFQRDLHGDLHGGNIFLYKPPILFDCIEFSDEYRQIDLLYEIAFLCMELEAEGHGDLSEHFVKDYAQRIFCFETPVDRTLFSYYKCLRANIRAKVLAIGVEKSGDSPSSKKQLDSIRNYLRIMEDYMGTTG